MPYYLGIDGGGTKTTCAVGDESTKLVTATAGPSNIVRVGAAQTRESLQQAVRQACAAAGIAPAQVVRTCVGASGAGRPDLASAVREFLAEILPTPINVVGDMEIALEAAFGDDAGVIVNAGTGSFAYGRNRSGQTHRVGGWGFAIGDEGSAHWIGREAVSAILRASDEDGSVGARPLAKALCKNWGAASLIDLARAANSVPPPDFSSLFPAVAASDDPIAEEILKCAGTELARTANVAVKRLFAKDEAGPVPVAILGSVFRHSETVRDVFYNELHALDERAEITKEVVEPVDGALRMARRVKSLNR